MFDIADLTVDSRRDGCCQPGRRRPLNRGRRGIVEDARSLRGQWTPREGNESTEDERERETLEVPLGKHTTHEYEGS